MGCIYKHVSKTTGKVYIGQTQHNNPNKRWLNGLGYKEQNFGKAIELEGGWQNFEHYIIEKDVPNSLLNEREKFWIKYYDATNPDKGYNKKPGGSGSKKESDTIEMIFRQLPEEFMELPLSEVYKQFPSIKKQIDKKLYSKYYN